MKYNSSVLFQAKCYILCTKGANHSEHFLYFLVLLSKITKFLSFLKEKIGFSSSFLLFSIMRNNSSVPFELQFYILLTKGAYQSTNLVKFQLSSRKTEILHFGGLLL